MKKWGLFLFLMSVFLFYFPQLTAQAAESSQFKEKMLFGVNDRLLTPPGTAVISEGNRVYVSLDRFTELDIEIQWINQNEVTLYKKNDRNKLLHILFTNRLVTDKRGFQKSIEILQRQQTQYVSAEAICSYFGYNVQYLKQGPVIRFSQTTAKLTDAQFLQKHKQQMFTVYNPPAQKKRIPIYLTFDDGPGPFMDSILNTLKSKKAKATFFMIEPQMKKYSSLVKRSIKEGHYPALHSVSHDKRKLYGKNTAAIGLEMEAARKTLLQITGVSSRLTRVPYGSKPYMTVPYRNSLSVRGFKMWDWNVDTEDWRYQKTDSNRILENCLAGVKKMKGKQTPAVVLMHVNKGTAESLPKLIDSLQKQGYECVAYNQKAHFVLNFWGDKRL
ncbi:polysaccharide deacetylase family protein [Peribacillus deserti]|uniref:NodB homology domain-containing protein n=1 Tax=Peribacillus deserti TaxID=673318 RepID=A0A2N5M445_9BACI|nr:polysaccharide deacetylase family protein [Peribacillus deserti]PLT29127.1 hypothetical protein CUU66_15030 [Peribacillus deserti]